MRNAALREYVRAAATDYGLAGGRSVSGFVEWLEGAGAPEEPSLWRYAAGERTYVAYAMDPWVVAGELGCGMTVEEVDRALAQLQGDREAPVTSEDIASLWSDEMNDMVCNDADLIGYPVRITVGKKSAADDSAPLTSQQRWNKCHAELCQAVSPEECRQSFDVIRFERFEVSTSKLFIQVPNKETYEYMEHHLVDVMSRIIPKYFGANFMLQYHLP